MFAAEIAAELLEADRIAVEEGLIVEALDQQRMAECEDHRGIGVGPDRQPFDIAACVEIVGRRRHIDEAHAGLAQAEQAAPDAMDGSAAGVDLAVLARHATEGDEKLAVPGEHIPARVARQQLFKRSHDMRHQHQRSADAVIILVAHEPADRIEEAPYLALGVVETSGTRPAIGTTENGLVAEFAFHAGELAGHQIKRLIPRNLDKRLGAAALGEGARTLLEPALAYGGATHAQAFDLVGQHVQADRRGIGIFREGMQLDGLAGLVVLDFVDAPMGHRQRSWMLHGTSGPGSQLSPPSMIAGFEQFVIGGVTRRSNGGLGLR